MSFNDKNIRLITLLVGVLALILFALTACSPSSSSQDVNHHEDDEEYGAVERSENNGAVIHILSPQDDAIFMSDEDILIEIEVENFEIGEESGHWHIYIDDLSYGMVVNGKTDAIISGLDAGEHHVAVYLSAFTHVELKDGDSIHIVIE